VGCIPLILRFLGCTSRWGTVNLLDTIGVDRDRDGLGTRRRAFGVFGESQHSCRYFSKNQWLNLKKLEVFYMV